MGLSVGGASGLIDVTFGRGDIQTLYYGPGLSMIDVSCGWGLYQDPLQLGGVFALSDISCGRGLGPSISHWAGLIPFDVS